VSSKRTPADDAARRTTILNAASWCFLHFGYARTSLEDIAVRASISRPLLYKMFRNKEEIFAAVFADMFERQYPAVERVLAAPGGTRAERLMATCEITLLEPWAELSAAPMAAECFEACSKLAPEVEAAHEKRMLRYAQAILGSKPLAEVFLLALDGLQSDLPPIATLRRRVQLLVDRFAV
jgi:AcrR family transcriptional regulator